MKLDWRARARAALQQRTRRERGVLLGAGVALILLLGEQFWIEPALLRHRLLQQRIEQQRADLQALVPELQVLRAKNPDPDAGRKAQLELLRTRLAHLDDEFAQLQRSLVAPREMGQLIEGLLQQHGGLQVVALRNLPVIPLTQRDAGIAAAAANAASAAASAVASAASTAASGPVPNADPDAWLYLHGVQLTVQGSYADMQAYLDALEHLPRRVYWGPLKIDAQAWPASVMTVTLYTVSLERTWWSV